MKLLIILLILGFSISLYSYDNTDFVTKWKTTGVDETITIPTSTTNNPVSYYYNIDCNNDGIDEGTNITGNYTCSYTTPGEHIVVISGTFPHIRFFNATDSDKILSVEQWGTGIWSTMFHSFDGCSNLEISATDTPNLSQVTNMNSTFKGTTSFNNDISSWDVSNVTIMNSMFEGSSFNQDINSWNVSNVTNMESMFKYSSFNQPLNNWIVSSVANMSSMFYGTLFNQNINNWNVSNVTDISFMFASSNFNQPLDSWIVSNVTNMMGVFLSSPFDQDISNWNTISVTNMWNMFRSSSFNQDISRWNVSNVTNMHAMFYSDDEFNQDISSWDVSNVTDMKEMFWHATSFDQNIGSWNIINVTDMTDMFLDVTLSTINYDALLTGWSSKVLKNGVTFHAGNSKYCSAESERADIISTYSWNIIDGGKYCEPICGNGVIESGETCDDLNTDNGDGCSSSCVIEFGYDCSSGTCEDINECDTNNGGCSEFESCTNNTGAVPDCEDINECLVNNGDCGNPTYILCTNNIGAVQTCSDIDTDNDGLTDRWEDDNGTNKLLADSDADGLNDLIEVGDLNNPFNHDDDDIIDANDSDDDNDGILTKYEVLDGDSDPRNLNTDSDLEADDAKVPNYLDNDDDGDSKLTINEHADDNGDHNPDDALDSDNDGTPNYLDNNDTDGPDADADEDGLLNREEGVLGTNPNNSDSDNDGIDDMTEVGSILSPIDTDEDGVIDAIDSDDDNDTILTKYEDLNNDGDFTNDDTDEDGTPNYLDNDDDGDSILTKDESPDSNDDGNPDDAKDTDNDNIADYLDNDEKQACALCTDEQTCVDSICLYNCSSDNQDGYCEDGRSCFNGLCIENNILCSIDNPTGVCKDEKSCIEGVCTDVTILIDPQDFYINEIANFGKIIKNSSSKELYVQIKYMNKETIIKFSFKEENKNFFLSSENCQINYDSNEITVDSNIDCTIAIKFIPSEVELYSNTLIFKHNDIILRSVTLNGEGIKDSRKEDSWCSYTPMSNNNNLSLFALLFIFIILFRKRVNK